MTVGQMVVGSWNRTHGAGKNLASKLAALCAEFDAAHSYEAFYHKYSDTSLWYVSTMFTERRFKFLVPLTPLPRHSWPVHVVLLLFMKNTTTGLSMHVGWLDKKNDSQSGSSITADICL